MNLRIPCLLAGAAAFLLAQPGWGLRTSAGNPALLPVAREGHAMAWDQAAGRVMLFGGQKSFGSTTAATGETWEWTGASWILKTAGFGLARRDHALAGEPGPGGALLFGGLTSTGLVLGDTLRWNGASWTSLFPPALPAGRSGHAMAYDSQRQRTVLFGGSDAQFNLLADTWEWDGSTWIPVSSPLSPPARRDHALVYDSSRGVTVLFGGSAPLAGGFPFADTWEWDGVTWTQRTPSGAPSARSHHALAFDPVRGRTQLFGGRSGGGAAMGDHWEWDGTYWFPAAAASLPPARYGAALVFDGGAGEPFLFGGSDGTTVHADSWQYSQGGAGGGQANGISARLEVEERGFGTGPGPFTVTVTPGSLLNLRWFGAPGAGFLLALGPSNPGALHIPGVGSLDVGTSPGFGDLFIVLDGVANPGIALGPFGQAQQALYVPPAPPGTVLATVQGGVLQPPGSGAPLVLTAAFLITT